MKEGCSQDNCNAFQLELFFGGRIAFHFEEVSARDGVTGLSRGGGLPELFREADLSAQQNRTQCPPDTDGDWHSDLDLFDVATLVNFFNL